MPDILKLAQLSGEFLDLIGVFIILVGTILATSIVISDFFTKGTSANLYKSFRHNLGRSILIGLEFLIAGDIIRSVTGTPNFTSVGVLVVVVLIRSFLSMTFEMEIEGKWPWQKSK